MPATIYRIELASAERSALEEIRDRGSNKAAGFKHATALIMCDEGAGGPASKDSEIATALGIKAITDERLTKRCCEVGPLAAIECKRRETGPRGIKLTGEVEAHITRLACSDPPDGHKRWILALIAGKLVELQVVGSMSRPSVGKVLKNANSSRGA